MTSRPRYVPEGYAAVPLGVATLWCVDPDRAGNQVVDALRRVEACLGVRLGRALHAVEYASAADSRAALGRDVPPSMLMAPLHTPELALVKSVETLEFEHFVCSHGMLGKKADVSANIRYREELRAAVAKAIAAGQTLEQAQASVTMDSYKDWEFYAQQRPANVAGTYRALTSGR